MCGFVCSYAKRPGGLPSRARFDRMSATLRHRGPDQEGEHFGPRIAMGHHRLSIIDLTGGKQPMASADGKVWIAFNGEIYNYKDVVEALRREGVALSGTSDTEALLAAYLRWGTTCLDRLNGMFTFVIHDGRDETLFAARDRFGEKPLYVVETEDTIHFTSELKALVATGVLEPALDRVALYQYFTYGYVVGPRTIFEGARRLGPGSALRVERGATREWTYWAPPAPSDLVSDPSEAASRTLALLRDSVRLRMVSDVPVGFFLSGGVDSSAVVALASEVASGPVETFSVGFDEPRYDERKHARTVAERFGTKHHEFVLGPRGIDVLEKLTWHLDEPFADSSALPTYFLSELTRRHVKVALSGDGGDEMFAGYDAYKGHVLSERVQRIPAPLMRAGLAGLWTFARRQGALGRLHKRLTDAMLPVETRFLSKQQVIFRKEFLEGVAALPFVEEGARLEEERFRGLLARYRSPLEAMASWQGSVSLVDDMLVKVDRMSMAHSLEVRAPFLDHRISELVWSMPFSVKVPGTRTKYVLKKALEGHFPKAFLWRPKMGFVVPLDFWFRDDLHAYAKGVLLDPRARVGRMFHADGLRRVLADAASGAGNGHALWALLMFETWCRVFGIEEEALEALGERVA